MKDKENSKELDSGKRRKTKEKRLSQDTFVVQNLHLKQINIEELIYVVRGQKVMIDSDLAMIFEEETKYLKRSVRKHIKRFPDDFMFELTKEEYASLRCKNSTIKSNVRNKYICEIADQIVFVGVNEKSSLHPLYVQYYSKYKEIV